MQFKRRMLGGLLFFITLPIFVNADVLWIGVTGDGSTRLFIITDADGQMESPWLTLGDSFDGSRIETYDGSKGILTIRRRGEVLNLELRNPKATAADDRPTKVSRQKRLAAWVARLEAYHTVLRVVAQAGENSLRYTVVEVWKGNDGSPRVGDVLKGLPMAGAEKSETYERLVCFGDKGSAADMSLFRGLLPGVNSDITANELRDALAMAPH